MTFTLNYNARRRFDNISNNIDETRHFSGIFVSDLGHQNQIIFLSYSV